MIDTNRFVAKWNGRYIDFDKKYGAQCTDIVKQWEAENGWSISHGSAIDYAKGEPGFNFVKNTPTGVPPAGSIVVFRTGLYGHVAIALPGSNSKTLIAFSQNDPLGSKCSVRNYNYVSPRCLGWLVKS